MNIVVFPCGSEIGLEICRAFKGVRNVNLIGASSVADHGEFAFAEHEGGIPFVDSPDFIPAINALIQRRQIELIFPAHDSVIFKLAQSQIDCDVVGSPPETCEITRSKRKTYEHLRGVVRVPEVYNPRPFLTDAHFPLFLKPEVGQGSKGTSVARNMSDVDYRLANDPSLLILEYLPGEEYTVDCFTDFNGELLFVGGRTRSRIINGISVRTSPVDLPEFHELASKINGSLQLNGAWFFQLKRTQSGELCLLEVASRIAWASAVTRARGVNLPVLTYYNHLRLPVRIQANDFDVTMERSWSNRYRTDLQYGHVYVDFDDCLCLGGKVNSELIGFLYQCLNQGKRLHLLSRYVGDLAGRLAELRLGQLFDSVTQTDGNYNKSRYITETPAIFIDDSFAEREEVRAALGIPVFAVDAVECLHV